MTADLIAVDWGTSRFRAYLLGGDKMLAQVATDDGVAGLEAADFAAVLARHCGVWRTAAPRIPVLMAGMIGSRNGWREVPYVTTPCNAASIAAGIATIAEGVRIVPGVIQRGVNGAVDVMRGEETLALGAGVGDGVVCMPGTHAKWVAMRDGAIQGFATFVTGELYGLVRSHAFVARLAEDDEDPRGFATGLAAAEAPSGLLHGLFGMRARVLGGTLSGRAARPYLSGLLVGAEVRAALELHPGTTQVRLVADAPLIEPYRQALEHRGCAVSSVSTEATLIAGLRRLTT